MSDQVFISYSHQDGKYREELLTHLVPYVRAGSITAWSDKQILPGSKWLDEIRDELAKAKVAVMLVSPHFLASDFIHREEFLPLLGKAEKGGVTILWVPVIACGYEETALKDYQAVASPETPLAEISDDALRASAWKKVCQAIKKAVSQHPPPDKSAPTEPTPLPHPIAHSRLLDLGVTSRFDELVGRAEERGTLDQAWDDPNTRILIFVAPGGVGKTSLITDWMVGLLHHHPEGLDAFFDWSFYSQGTQDQGAANSGPFLAAALRHFGETELADGPAPADAKADRLAERVAKRRTLLLLDGLEPLQHPSHATGLAGRLKDLGLERLLKRLAQLPGAGGLCVLTSRLSLVDLKRSHGRGVRQENLSNLSASAAARLLHQAGADHAGDAEIAPDDRELLAAAGELKGHALSAQLLGSYLSYAQGGDIRRRDRVDWSRAIDQEQEGHVRSLMRAYEYWFSEQGETGHRQLAILRLLGLFDRPARRDLLDALGADPAIPGLTGPSKQSAPLPPRVSQKPLSHRERGWGEGVKGQRSAPFATSSPGEGLGERGSEWAERGSEWEERESKWAERGSRQNLSIPSTRPGPTTEDWNQALTSLAEDHRLISLQRTGGDMEQIDAHPLIRAYFAHWLQQENNAAWVEGHRRLYQQLCETTEHRPDTLEGLQPLYQAVAHGCRAGLHQRACDDVYHDRILRGTGTSGSYSTKKLGAIDADLGAVACLFDRPWDRPSPNLSAPARAWLLGQAAYYLHALGRLAEALMPMRAGLEMDIGREDWKNAAIGASGLSELELTLGDLSAAITDAERSVHFADRSQDAFEQMARRTAHADVLHQAGRADEALGLFMEAEALQADREPAYPRLYSGQGFRYCDLLLSGAECAAWRWVLDPMAQVPNLDTLQAACDQTAERAGQTLEWAEQDGDLLSIALDRLTLGRAALYKTLLNAPDHGANGASSPAPSTIPMPPTAIEHLTAAVNGLRESGFMDDLPRGLLSRAWQLWLVGDAADAAADLDEAWELAERGPMRLFQADIRLTRARLFGRADPYPWESPQEDLAAARRLIEKHGYHRRDQELAAAEAAFKVIRGQSPLPKLPLNGGM